MSDAPGRNIPSRLAEWMQPFRGAFTAPTWHHVMVLVMGAILVPGRRTVASALRATGLDQIPNFTNYHRVLNRNKWSARWLGAEGPSARKRTVRNENADQIPTISTKW